MIIGTKMDRIMSGKAFILNTDKAIRAKTNVAKDWGD